MAGESGDKAPMAQSPYDRLPPCCQKILIALDREHRTGARNCENGHLVSLEYADRMQKQPPAKPGPAPGH